MLRRPHSSASSPGHLQRCSTSRVATPSALLAPSAPPSLPRKSGSYTLVLGPRACQQIEISSASSSSSDSASSMGAAMRGSGRTGADANAVTGARYSPPPSPSPIRPAKTSQTRVEGADTQQEAQQSSSTSDLRRIQSFDHVRHGRSRSQSSASLHSVSARSVRSEGSVGHAVERRIQARASIEYQSSAVSREPQLATLYRPPRVSEASSQHARRSGYTERKRTLHDHQETSPLWSRTQPGLEVEVLLRDDSGQQHFNERILERGAILDELLAESPPPKYATTCLPHRVLGYPPLFREPPNVSALPAPARQTGPGPRASVRPNLPTILSSRIDPRAPPFLPQSLPSGPTPADPVHHAPTAQARKELVLGFALPAKLVPPMTVSGEDAGQCDACGRQNNGGHKMMMVPCAHIVCSSCFGSAISAVSAKMGPSKCTSCLSPVRSFKRVERFSQPSTSNRTASPKPKSAAGENEAGANRTMDTVKGGTPTTTSTGTSKSGRETSEPTCSTGKTSADSPDSFRDKGAAVVLRIDNVAWDITPDTVLDFLPDNVVSSAHLSPVHILLDRYDGRTRDYMYVEVKSVEAARHILQTRQNALMPCGPLNSGRRRAVTVSLVPHDELLGELRPRSAAELDSLLTLCQAAVTIPYLPLAPASARRVGHPGVRPGREPDAGIETAISGAAHFVKSRHGPFYALMSVLSKLSGRGSPAYWDLYRVASGAIAALASAIDRNPRTSHSTPTTHSGLNEDKRVLEKLRELHVKCFAMTPEASSGEA